MDPHPLVGPATTEDDATSITSKADAITVDARSDDSAWMDLAEATASRLHECLKQQEGLITSIARGLNGGDDESIAALEKDAKRLAILETVITSLVTRLSSGFGLPSSNTPK